MKLQGKHVLKVSGMGIMVLITTMFFLSIFYKLLDNPLILASFASSVFVIIAKHRTYESHPIVIVSSHLIAACIGFALSFITVSLYPAILQPHFFPINGAFAVGLTAIMMILFRVSHAPAAATALSFSYNMAGTGSWLTLGIVLLMILALGLVKGTWHLITKFLVEIEQELFELEHKVLKHKKK